MESFFFMLLLFFVTMAAVVLLLKLFRRCPDCNGKWEKPLNKNPYRRFCSACGRQEDWFEQGHAGWWEPMNREK